MINIAIYINFLVVVDLVFVIVVFVCFNFTSILLFYPCFSCLLFRKLRQSKSCS